MRSLGRGGAFVAGADDQQAVWYNPAGLTEAGNGVLFDASLLLYFNSYARQSLPPGASEVVNYPSVSGTTAPLPIPTLVFSHNFNQRHFMFAAGIFAPNSVLTTFPDPDAQNSPYGRTPPQRYSSISLDGSLLSIVGMWAAYEFAPQVSAGIGVQALVGTFVSRLSLTACPATITCAPEDPDWDAMALLRVGPIIAPSGNAGLRWQPVPWLRFGLSGQLPFWVSAPATLGVRLPSSAYFNGAEVHGDRAEVSFTLAPIVRLGVEVRPTRIDRIELTGVWEGWSVHDRISLSPTHDASQPNGIQITGVRGVGTYDVGNTAIDRGFQDAWSVRLGYERDQLLGGAWHLFPRLGIAYETSATSPAYTSVLTQDSTKVTFTGGASVANGRVRVDAVIAYVATPDVAVDPRDGRLYQVRPFRTNNAPQYAINGGVYTMSSLVLGLGLRYSF